MALFVLISNIKIDSHVSCLTVFLNASLITLYLVTGIPWCMVVVAVDYGVRAMWKPKYSLLRWLAAGVINLGGFSPKMFEQTVKETCAHLLYPCHPRSIFCPGVQLQI